MIRRTMPAVMAALALAGCETIRVPSCAELLNAADTVEAIAALLEARGIEPESAAKVAEAVRQGRIAAQIACTIAG